MVYRDSGETVGASRGSPSPPPWIPEFLETDEAAPGKSCDDGSWDPAVDKWGSIGGRVYATAINVLTLEVYYRYAHVFGGRKD